MILLEALELTLEKEEAALEMYCSLSLKHTAIKDLFLSLANEEEKHKK